MQASHPELPTFERQIAPTKLGKYIATLPDGSRERVLAAIRHAEMERGEPPFLADVYRSMSKVSSLPRPNFYDMFFAFNDVYRNDECLTNTEIDRVSLNKDLQSREGNKTKYELFSDRFHKFYPTYVLDENLVARSGPESLTMNFHQLKKLLLSKDLSKLSELDWISQQNL